MNRSMGMIAGFALGVVCVSFMSGTGARSVRTSAATARPRPEQTTAVSSCDIPPELMEPHFLSATRQSFERELRMLVSCDFREIPLQEALLQFEKQSGLHFVLREDRLKADGSEVTPLTPISFFCQNMPLKRALRKILFPLGLIHFVDDDEIGVTTIVTAGKSSTRYSIRSAISRRGVRRIG